MCTPGTSALFVYVLIFFSDFKEGSSTGDAVLSLPTLNSITATKESTATQYSIDYSDYMEPSTLSKHETTRLDFFDVVPGVQTHVENQTTSVRIINKCCARNYYLDVDNLLCVPEAGEGVTKPEFFRRRVKSDNIESGHLLREGMPDCGVRAVMSVRVVSRVWIEVSGLTIEGEGVLGKYCIDGHPKYPLETVVVACEEPLVFCKTRTCYRKCCPLGYAYGRSERKCKRTEEPFRPAFYNLSSLSRVKSPRPWQGGIYFSDACGSKGKYLLERDLGEVSYLGIDGTLLVPSFGKRFPESEFCMELVKNGNGSAMESFLCFSKSGAHFENSPLQFFLLSLGFIISCMFLMLTFLVYLLTPKCQNLYGKTLMCYIACLFTAYLCLAVIEFKSKEVDKAVCTYMGYFLLFAFLAAFFWLNVISFDIWKTFRLNRSVERSKSDKGKLQFLRYSFYAWGFPSAITSVCAYVNQAQSFPYEAIRPDIGVENCWFSKKKKGIYVFFIAPISLVIALNIIFYVQTAWKIWRVKSEVKKMEKQKTKRFSANKDQFIINGKLFIVMGLTWSLEIISYFAPHPIWYITDTANALHGVFIFAVFVLKKKVLQQVSEQVRAPLKRIRQFTTSNSDDPFTPRTNFQDSNPEGKPAESGSFSNG